MERDLPGPVVVTVRTPGRMIATLSGSLDLAAVDDVATRLRSAMAGAGPGILELDLAAVDFCDAAGLRMLLSTQAEGARRGCPVVISAISPMMAWLLRLAGLDATFGYPSPESARDESSG